MSDLEDLQIRLDRLGDSRRVDVFAAVAAVESAAEPVSDLNGLDDPGLRAIVAAVLATQGRELLHIGDGWLSGYADDITDRLAADGIGVLVGDDATVMALVLLYTVAIPRAEGLVRSADWTAAVPVDTDVLLDYPHLSNERIRAALRRLKDAGILVPGHRSNIAPGPQFLRLTETSSVRLWDEMILLADPDGPLANRIRRNRAV